jgi:hypothetical protein
MLVQLSSKSIPRAYVCPRASAPIVIDGKLDDAAWGAAPWTEDFVDIEGDKKPTPRFKTRVKMLWDDECLYVGAEIEEPQLQASLTEHDSVIFHDNDFEIFMDPDGDNQLYSEFEMNALNTTWDLLLVKPYRAGGPPVDGFELKGLRSAVHLDGNLNDPTSTDKGWSVEIAIPWHALEQIAGCPCPPKDGDQWRINFSRVEWHWQVAEGKYQKVPGTKEDNWVWSPQGVVDMHRPEHWGILQFSSSPETAQLHPYPGLEEKFVLCRLWDAEDAYREKTGHWGSLSEIGFHEPGVKLSLTPDLFEGAYRGYRIDQNLRFWRATPPKAHP